MQDSTTTAARTPDACKQGHPLTGDNLASNGFGRAPACKTCKTARKPATTPKRDAGEARRRASDLRRALRNKIREEDPARYAAMQARALQLRKEREKTRSEQSKRDEWIRRTENRKVEAEKRVKAREWGVTVIEYNSLLAENELTRDELVRDQNRPSAAWNVLKVKGDALPVWEEFSQHLETTVTPCQGKNEEWTDFNDPRPGREDEATGIPMPSRAEAKRMCEPCPLIDLCQKFAQKDRPDFGVWGGRVYLGGKPQ